MSPYFPHTYVFQGLFIHFVYFTINKGALVERYVEKVNFSYL